MNEYPSSDQVDWADTDQRQVHSMAVNSKYTVIEAGDQQVDYFFDDFEEVRQFFAGKTLVDLVPEQLELNERLNLMIYKSGIWHVVTEGPLT